MKSCSNVSITPSPPAVDVAAHLDKLSDMSPMSQHPETVLWSLAFVRESGGCLVKRSENE